MTHVTQHVRRRGPAAALLAAGIIAGFVGALFLLGPSAEALSKGPKTFTTTDNDFSLDGCSAAPCASHRLVAATCADGGHVVGGGVANVGENGPSFGDGGDVEVHQSYPVVNQYGESWAVDLTSINGATHVDATAYVICVK